jgi:uncharacterized phage protein gp47/JayE
MPEATEQVYKDAEQIVAEVIAAWQSRISDINSGTDSIVRIWAEVFANSVEGLYLAQQLLHDDMFIQSANALALDRYGDTYSRPRHDGTLATGTLRLSGSGGTFIPLGTQVGMPRPAQDDVLIFATTVAATIPAPGIPTAPVAADAGAGTLNAGTYEFAVSFQTIEGETAIGPPSNALAIIGSHNINLTAIPLGGAGTTARNLYMRINGGAWAKVTTAATVASLNNNTATTVTVVLGTSGGLPLDTSTAERVTVAATAAEVGVDYNVGIGAITDLVDVVSGLSGVTNAVAFTGGSEQEDIETFRTELLKRVRAPQSGSILDLQSWATDVEGVGSATAVAGFNLAGAATPGTVAVRITAADGSIAGAPLIASVLAYLLTKDLANISIEVGTYTANTINVAATITPATGYVLADVQDSARLAVLAYINSVAVGATVYKAGIVDAIFGLAGIADVNVTAPAANTTQTATQKAIMSTWTPS